jgi:hypothetical protein
MNTRIVLVIGMAVGVVGTARAEETGADPASAPRQEAVLPATHPNAAVECTGCRGTKEQFWVTGEYLLGWIQGAGLPPLVTTSPAGTAQAAAGVLGSPSTSILFGDNRVDADLRSGLRFGMGYWFTPERTLGIEAGAMWIDSKATIFSASSNGAPILARPFFDVSTLMQNSLLVAFPGSSTGSIDIRAASGNLYEAHIDLVENLADCGCFRLNSLFGYRFYRYDEGLHIQESMLPTNPLFAAGTQIVSIDSFTTSNTFHGGDFGLRSEFVWQRFCLGLSTSMAVGNVSREVKINGSQTTTVPGVAPVTQTGGLLALSTNIGNHHSDDWTVIPELKLDVSWRATENVRLRLGYSILGLDRFVRAADQVDFIVNSNFLPPAASPVGPARPAFILKRDDIWVQTLSLGVELSF